MVSGVYNTRDNKKTDRDIHIFVSSALTECALKCFPLCLSQWGIYFHIRSALRKQSNHWVRVSMFLHRKTKQIFAIITIRVYSVPVRRY